MKNKFLLVVISLLCFGATKVSAQLLIQESFDNPTFPPTGWSTNGVGPNYGCGNYNWMWGQSNQPLCVYFSTASNPVVPTHSGLGMAGYESFYNYYNAYSYLISPSFDLTTAGGIKKVFFWMYRSSTPAASNYVRAYINTAPNTAGATILATIYASSNQSPTVTTPGWYLYSYTIPAAFNGPTNYIIFYGYTTSYYQYDMFIDDVTVANILPCTGIPTGTIITPLACPGSSFTMYYSDTLSTGLTYSWEQSPDSNVWYNVGINSYLTTTITVPSYFRVTVHCSTSNQSYTVAQKVSPAAFYYCYCKDSTGGTHVANIGNVKIEKLPDNTVVLDNGIATPILSNLNAVKNYTNYDFIQPTTVLYRDSTYRWSVTQHNLSNTFSPSPVQIFIDLNRDGLFDSTEIVFYKNTLSASSPIITDTFKIPLQSQVGMTGMRVILQPGITIPPSFNPCTAYGPGETEDYVVNLSYSPCNGPATAGTARTTDTFMCPGYTFRLTDTTYEKTFINLQRNWVASTDGGLSWANVNNGAERDTITLAYSVPVWYKVRMICSNTHDTTYSNIVKIYTDSIFRCYCYSIAVGNDSSDIGAFKLGTYFYTVSNGVNNSHLNNPNAILGRGNYTHAPMMDLWADSTYDLMVYHILRHNYHGDAKITIFLDYNASYTYEPLVTPSELVWKTFTSDTDFFLQNYITIPHNVSTETPVGLRVILNNNTGPNTQSDDACGSYGSGETMDFVVVFHIAAVGTGNIENLREVSLFPNPTSGKFTTRFNTMTNVKELRINVFNITGQQLISREFMNTQGSFSTDLDLTAYPKGIYFVEYRADGERMIRKITVN